MRKKNASTTRVDMETQTDLTLSEMDIILKLMNNYKENNNSYINQCETNELNETNEIKKENVVL